MRLEPTKLTSAGCSFGKKIKIGAFSVAIDAEVRDRHLISEIADLYGIYPQEPENRLSDLAIQLRYPNLLRMFLGNRIQALVNGLAPFRPMPPRLVIPMLESCINWFISTSTTRFLLLHSAVVERNGMALLLAGASGAGKSTLGAALISRGWRLLSDEAAMVRPADGLIQPYPRPLCLKNSSIDLIAKVNPKAHLSKRYEGTTKGTVAFMRVPPEAIARGDEAARPALVVFLRYDPRGRVALEHLAKAPAFMELIDHSANYSTMLEKGFDALARLVEACDHYSLSYRSLDDALGMIEELAPGARRD